MPRSRLQRDRVNQHHSRAPNRRVRANRHLTFNQRDQASPRRSLRRDQASLRQSRVNRKSPRLSRRNVRALVLASRLNLRRNLGDPNLSLRNVLRAQASRFNRRPSQRSLWPNRLRLNPRRNLANLRPSPLPTSAL
jgi:hypothetical protein